MQRGYTRRTAPARRPGHGADVIPLNVGVAIQLGSTPWQPAQGLVGASPNLRRPSDHGVTPTSVHPLFINTIRVSPTSSSKSVNPSHRR